MDGKKRPYSFCATDDLPGAKPLLVIVGPGVSDEIREDGKGGKRMTQVAGFAEIAHDMGLSCVVMRATGRGPGSLFQNYGEVDLFEAIEDVCSKFDIDRDRISIHGNSMGGAAVYYLVSHYPDMFSAGVPTAGYCDYRLWEKPGGSTFHMPEWEEPSCRARSRRTRTRTAPRRSYRSNSPGTAFRRPRSAGPARRPARSHRGS